jgi:hypothetical protein
MPVEQMRHLWLIDAQLRHDLALLEPAGGQMLLDMEAEPCPREPLISVI